MNVEAGPLSDIDNPHRSQHWLIQTAAAWLAMTMETIKLVGGCDIGSATGKAVVIRDRQVLFYAIIPSTTNPEITARQVMDKALKKRESPLSEIWTTSLVQATDD